MTDDGLLVADACDPGQQRLHARLGVVLGVGGLVQIVFKLPEARPGRRTAKDVQQHRLFTPQLFQESLADGIAKISSRNSTTIPLATSRETSVKMIPRRRFTSWDGSVGPPRPSIGRAAFTVSMVSLVPI